MNERFRLKTGKRTQLPPPVRVVKVVLVVNHAEGVVQGWVDHFSSQAVWRDALQTFCTWWTTIKGQISVVEPLRLLHLKQHKKSSDGAWKMITEGYGLTAG